MMHPVNNDTSVTRSPVMGKTGRPRDLWTCSHRHQTELIIAIIQRESLLLPFASLFADRRAEGSTMENDPNVTVQQKKLLTVEDIQSIFKIGKTTAYQLMRSNGFPALRVNHRLYVSQEALDDWIRTYSGRQFLI